MSEIVLNSGIAGVVGLITLVLTRLFSRKDTVYENLVRDQRNLRAEVNWLRAVNNLMDQELYELRRAWAASPASTPLPPRKDWPIRPDVIADPAARP